MTQNCKGCGEPLDPEEVRNALSRYNHGYICSDCGVREAFNGDFIKRFYDPYLPDFPAQFLK